MMTTEKSKPQLGYLETISQVLALKTEHLVTEHPAIWQVLEQVDEATFIVLPSSLCDHTSKRAFTCRRA